MLLPLMSLPLDLHLLLHDLPDATSSLATLTTDKPSSPSNCC